MTCECINHFYRAGRAQYKCTRCESDVTMQIVLMAQSGIEIPPIIPTEFPTEKKLLTDIYRGKHPNAIRNELAKYDNPILSKEIVEILQKEKGIYDGYISE